MNKISVVIPAYNAVKTVERTILSVFASSIPLDVWVVDDGSTDGTGALLDGLAKTIATTNGSRFIVFHQPNCGAYQARLNALKKIKTPYFGFVDADDTVDRTMYSKMIGLMEKHSLDVVQCGYDGALDPWTKRECPAILGNERLVRDCYVMPALVSGSMGGTFVWNKLYRNQYDFRSFDPTDKDTTFDDMIFNLQFFLRVGRMGFIDEPLYHYIINEGSSVGNFSAKTLHDFRECLRIRRKLLPEYGVRVDGPENREWFRRNKWNCIKAAIRSPKAGLPEKFRLVREILKTEM